MTVSLADIEAAARRLSGHALATPLIASRAIDAALGARVLFKPETRQRVGAFKFRGAYNRLAQMSAGERARGVVAFSSGNHGQGVALAARMLGMRAVIVMPRDAPTIKIEATRGHGADIVLYDRSRDDRAKIAAQIAAERGATLVPAFDDRDVIAGQGTVGLELFQEARAMGVALDWVLCPLGGGGLTAGIATAFEALSPATRIAGVEPAAYDDTARSLAAGERLTVRPDTRSLCDALEAPTPGEVTFPILQRTGVTALRVTDAEIADAVRQASSALDMVVEPSGAAGLAALLAGKVDVRGKHVGVVLSGGNVDPELHARLARGRE